MAAPLYVTQSGRLWHAGLILIVTVGLPGKHAALGPQLTPQPVARPTSPAHSSDTSGGSA